MGNLGHLLVYSKRTSQPFGIAIGSGLRLYDKDAMAVRDYALAHPFENVDPAAVSAEAGMQPNGDGSSNAPAAVASAEGGGVGDGMSSSSMPDTAMVHSGELAQGSHKHAIGHDGAEAKRLHFFGYEDVPHGDVIPQTPISVAEEFVHDTSFEQMASPAKTAKHGDSGIVSLVNFIRNIEHMDIELDVPLEFEDVDILMQHELNLEDNPMSPKLMSKLS